MIILKYLSFTSLHLTSFVALGLKFISRHFFAGIEQTPGGGEDLMTLEAEISELQRENARVESQMIKLKSDINAMESHLGQNEKVSSRFETLRGMF